MVSRQSVRDDRPRLSRHNGDRRGLKQAGAETVAFVHLAWQTSQTGVTVRHGNTEIESAVLWFIR